MTTLKNERQKSANELRILMLEDSELDARLIEEELGNSGTKYLLQHADDEASFKRALEKFNPDIILSDFCLPSYDGFLALDEVRDTNAEVPFIFISGAIGEELAIEALKRGATDCVNKSHLGKLAGALRRALDETDEKRKRRRAEDALDRLRQRNMVILDSAAEGIAGLDKEMHFAFINHSGLVMLGYSVKELVGEPLDAIIDEPPPAEAAAPAKRRGMARLSPGKSILTLRRKDGSTFQAEFAVSAVKDDRSSLGCVLSFNDITGRQKAEEEIKSGYERLRKILFGSIHAMSTALEFRDPYTAGHQKRVAELAVGHFPVTGIHRRPYRRHLPGGHCPRHWKNLRAGGDPHAAGKVDRRGISNDTGTFRDGLPDP